MKKVILGSALLICGMLGFLIALQDFSINMYIIRLGYKSPFFTIGGMILLILGIILNIWGFLEKDDK